MTAPRPSVVLVSVALSTRLRADEAPGGPTDADGCGRARRGGRRRGIGRATGDRDRQRHCAEGGAEFHRDREYTLVAADRLIDCPIRDHDNDGRLSSLIGSRIAISLSPAWTVRRRPLGRNGGVPGQGAENAASPPRGVDRSERRGGIRDCVPLPFPPSQGHVKASLTGDRASRSYVVVRRGA